MSAHAESAELQAINAELAEHERLRDACVARDRLDEALLRTRRLELGQDDLRTAVQMLGERLAEMERAHERARHSTARFSD